MLLEELFKDLKADMMVSMVHRLVDNDVLVHLETTDGRGKQLSGKIVGFFSSSSGIWLRYHQLQSKGGYDKEYDETSVTELELHHSQLEKLDDSTYTLHLANEGTEKLEPLENYND